VIGGIGECECPREGIRIKLSINSCRKFNRFVRLTQALAQDLRGGLPFSCRLGDQTFGGGTGPVEKAASCEFGLKDGLHPLLGQGLKMSDEFEHTEFPLFLSHKVARICGQRA